MTPNMLPSTNRPQRETGLRRLLYLLPLLLCSGCANLAGPDYSLV